MPYVTVDATGFSAAQIATTCISQFNSGYHLVGYSNNTLIFALLSVK